MAEIVATIDCGSNSFHLQIVERQSDGKIKILFCDKAKVQLRRGLTETQDDLLPQAQEKALTVLARFAEHIQKFPVTYKRFVGTYTLRQLPSDHAFFASAASLLGQPIEVISGEEEARLIYRGAHGYSQSEMIGLHVDIGGGSTEIIVGQGKNILACTSVSMGCVGFTEAFFNEGTLTEAAFAGAKAHAHRILDALDPGLMTQVKRAETYTGSSGTIKMVSQIVDQADWYSGPVTLEALQMLKQKLIAFGESKHIQLQGLRQDRIDILAGGLSVLVALFEVLHIEGLTLAKGGLREGLLVQ